MASSAVFVVEGHKRTGTQSVTSEVIAGYLDQVVNESAEEDEYEGHEPVKRPRSKKNSESVSNKI